MKITVRSLLTAALASSCGPLAADPMFHLKNNSADVIQVDIMQNGKSVLKGLESVKKHGDFILQNLDIKKDMVLDIYFCPTADWCKTHFPKKFSTTIFASPVPNKTVYIKFDGKKIEPQKGDSHGKTTKGYSNKNNLTNKDFSTPQITAAQELRTGTKEAIAGEIKTGIEETAWATFSQANAFRKSHNITDQQFDYVDMKFEDTQQKVFSEETQQKVFALSRLVLGVQKEAGASEIKKAYHKLSLTYHPDKYNLLPQEKKDQLPASADARNKVFQILSKAYENLTKK